MIQNIILLCQRGVSRANNIKQWVCYRGLLAGKVSRDKPPETGRLAEAAQTGGHNEGAPDWKKLQADEQLWNILDVTKRIAAKHGESSLRVYRSFVG